LALREVAPPQGKTDEPEAIAAPGGRCRALAAPLANYNTADAVEFLNTLELARAAETLAALPLPRAVKMLEAPELHRMR
jgi:magnesium transporter